MTARALLEVADEIASAKCDSLLPASLIAWERRIRKIASSLEGQADEHYQWRQEICARLGLDCAAGMTWTTDQVYEHVRELEIAAARTTKDKPA